MEWHSVKEKPICKDSKFGFKEAINLLVWVDDNNSFARGRCIEYADGDFDFSAEGFNGKWNITHWSYIEAPK